MGLFYQLSNRFIFSQPCSKDVRLPVQLQRAMAAEAEAAREARAKVIQSIKVTGRYETFVTKNAGW